VLSAGQSPCSAGGGSLVPGGKEEVRGDTNLASLDQGDEPLAPHTVGRRAGARRFLVLEAAVLDDGGLFSNDIPSSGSFFGGRAMVVADAGRRACVSGG
jgi:hypothetical protein